MIWNKPYEWVKENTTHLAAVGETDILIDAATAPWDKATKVVSGGAHRFCGPVGIYVVAQEGPITIRWSVDFEYRDANGKGVSLFERDRLRDVMRKLPPKARQSFADFLSAEVMPDLEKRTGEIREALNKQSDSEDCVRGLIAFASQKTAKAA